MAQDGAESFGEFIRRQRELHELSMRQVAEMAGISNPYLSQIEHGVREPSERVVEAIAANLEMSAEALKRHRARPAEERAGEVPAVVAAIGADKALTASQRKSLIEVYEAFVASRRPPGSP